MGVHWDQDVRTPRNGAWYFWGMRYACTSLSTTSARNS